MRFTVIRMISSSSLSAFSASLAQGGISGGAGAASGASTSAPVTRVRAAGMLAAPAQGSQPAPRLPQADPAGGSQPSRALPRGSLLDMSV